MKMMAEISVSPEANVVGKGFNLIRRLEANSSPEDSNFNNNNNNNSINTLEIPIIPSQQTTTTTNNSSSRSPSDKSEHMISPMMQITQISNNKKAEEGIEFEKEDGLNSPVEKRQSLKHFEDNSVVKMLESPNSNNNNNLSSGNRSSSSPRELQIIHQIHDEDEMNNSDDDENMILDEEEEDYSENEMMPGEDEDSGKEEHRITVREALLSRAFHAAKFGSGGKYSSTGSGGTTSRSGMISPSSSPGGLHHTQQVQHHHQMGNPLIKNPSVNGHGIRTERHGHGQQQQHQNQQQGHHRSSSFGSTGSLHNSHHQHLSNSSRQYHQNQQQQYHHDEPFIKSERKSHPSSPVQSQCDLKPDSLATESSLNGIGNALLSLASLGSLAALQQSIPNFMANVVGSGGLGQLGHHLQQQQQSQNQQQNSSNPSSIPPGLMNVPLNLTHSSTNSSTLTSNILTNSMGSSNHPHYPHHNPHHSQKHSKQQQQNSHLSPNSLISSSLQQAIANLANGGGGGAQSNAGSATPPGQQGSMPQLILASGQISQGIQGAQLLIPTSQGIMSQTVLTIPITQPGSPQNNMLSPSQQQHLSSIVGGSNSMSERGGQQQHHTHNKGHMNLGHRNICHPHSPSMTPGLPSSASPDFPGASGALPSPLMNLAPHLVGGHLPTIQEKMALEHNGGGGLNGLRNSHGKRERDSSNNHNTSGGLNVSALCPPKSSPCSAGGSSHGSDRCSDIDDSDQMVDGINLDEIKEFAKAFKLRRLSLGLTQTQVGQALSVTEGPAYSQSAICSALAWGLASQSYPPTSIHQQPMFEKLDITPKSAQKIKPVLERWMKEAEERYKNGHQNLNEFVGMEPSKKRKRRTSFTPQALEILNNHFERNTHPSGAEITTLAHQLGYEREVIRIWFCNKRQALKNTVRMMSK